jgi:thiol-disulfide isomerase/thioredoxin
MMTGLIVVISVLAAATAFGLWRKRVDGQVRNVSSGAGQGRDERVSRVLTPEQLGGERGYRATLVQFSSAFCQPCRATRAILADVAARTEGVAHIEIDAESHLALTRELGILKTPTTLVLDGTGRVVARAAGVPRKQQVLAAIGAAMDSIDNRVT